MAKKPVKYFVVDAFTQSAFKGNPAVVCFQDGEAEIDDAWLQSLAIEFNLSKTCFRSPTTTTTVNPRFRPRWFTLATEVDLCGHTTAASAHSLFSKGLVNSDVVELSTRCGILIAKRVSDISDFHDAEAKGSFLIELNFPAVPF